MLPQKHTHTGAHIIPLNPTTTSDMSLELSTHPTLLLLKGCQNCQKKDHVLGLLNLSLNSLHEISGLSSDTPQYTYSDNVFQFLHTG